jgi:hypothetical protein
MQTAKILEIYTDGRSDTGYLIQYPNGRREQLSPIQLYALLINKVKFSNAKVPISPMERKYGDCRDIQITELVPRIKA